MRCRIAHSQVRDSSGHALSTSHAAASMSWETGSGTGSASGWAREEAKDICDENAIKQEEHVEAGRVTEDMDL